MSTELMTATNDSGTIAMTGLHRDGKPRYQITICGRGWDGECYGLFEGSVISYLEVDAETIANMQRCVNHYETPEI